MALAASADAQACILHYMHPDALVTALCRWLRPADIAAFYGQTCRALREYYTGRLFVDCAQLPQVLIELQIKEDKSVSTRVSGAALALPRRGYMGEIPVHVAVVADHRFIAYFVDPIHEDAAGWFRALIAASKTLTAEKKFRVPSFHLLNAALPFHFLPRGVKRTVECLHGAGLGLAAIRLQRLHMPSPGAPTPAEEDDDDDGDAPSQCDRPDFTLRIENAADAFAGDGGTRRRETLRRFFPTSRIVIGQYKAKVFENVPRNVEIHVFHAAEYRVAPPPHPQPPRESTGADRQQRHIETLLLPSQHPNEGELDFVEWRESLRASGARFSNIALSVEGAAALEYTPRAAVRARCGMKESVTCFIVHDYPRMPSAERELGLTLASMVSRIALSEFVNLHSIEWQYEMPCAIVPDHVVRALEFAETLGCTVCLSEQVCPVPGKERWRTVFTGTPGARIEWTLGVLRVGDINAVLDKLAGRA
jgi:hypothetical protein